MLCFASNKHCPPYPKVCCSKFNQASVFTRVFPSAMFKVPPKFLHFLNFIAKYTAFLDLQCYSTGKSYALSRPAWRLRNDWRNQSENFLHFLLLEKSGIPIVLAASLIAQEWVDVKSFIFTIFYIKTSTQCWNFCWALKSAYWDSFIAGAEARELTEVCSSRRQTGHTWPEW